MEQGEFPTQVMFEKLQADLEGFEFSYLPQGKAILTKKADTKKDDRDLSVISV